MKPPWLVKAIGEMNVAEEPGALNNPRIIDYHSETTLRATSDEIPWCSSFVCWCFERCGIPSTRSASARSWLNWGIAIGKPMQGCVVILKRTSNPKQGHVGFLWSEDADMVYVLGGNQANKVCVMGFSKDKVLGYRMPEDEIIEDTTLN